MPNGFNKSLRLYISDILPRQIKDCAVGFPTSRWSFPGYFRFRFFTHYLDMRLPAHPRRSDCPGGFHSTVSQRTDLPIFYRMENRPTYCEVFTQPQKLQSCSDFWLEPTNFSCQGTNQLMSFALFTTLLRRVRLSQDNRWLGGIFILPFVPGIVAKLLI